MDSFQIEGAAAEVRLTVRNRAAAERDIRVSARIYEERSGREIETQATLIGSADPAQLYARRKDPVIGRYFFNLLSWAAALRGGRQ
jgi:hypothetical protein